MKLDQLEKYFKKGIVDTTKFENEHSEKKICEVVYELDEEFLKCNWIWKNDDTECEGECRKN